MRGYWGNANNWASSARNAGLVVDRRPEVGAVFQTSAGYYGHVGIVERVNNDGSFYVSEMNGMVISMMLQIEQFIIRLVIILYIKFFKDL